MMKYSVGPLVSVLGLMVSVGCGDSGGGTSASASEGSTGATGPGTGTGSSSSTSGASATVADPTEDAGSGTMSSATTPTTGATTDASATGTTGPGSSSTTDPVATDSVGSSSGTTIVDPGTSTSTGGDTSGDSSTGVVMMPDIDPCGGGMGMPDKGFLWAANSSQGTISKIDTDSVTEVGRYIVRPDKAGSPSRTSVSISGHVAVANRSGGVTKIYSNEAACPDNNGMAGIQTSKDANFLPWGMDECVAWYQPFNYQSQRPVAWGPGVFNKQTCVYEDEELWTSGRGGIAGIDILVLDGDDGTIKEKINVPTGGNSLREDFYGIYGGAVDPDGNFWGSQLGNGGKLIRVNRVDMSYDIFTTPPGPHWYGMSVDSDGIVWLCSNTVGRFDPLTETWKTAAVGGYTGCMADTGKEGLIWLSNGNGVVGVNRETLAVEKTWPAAGSYGVSIDFKGFVWVVANGKNASKIDPDTGVYVTYGGLVGAYTYSDMTGFSLQNNVFPQ